MLDPLTHDVDKISYRARRHGRAMSHHTIVIPLTGLAQLSREGNMMILECASSATEAQTWAVSLAGVCLHEEASNDSFRAVSMRLSRRKDDNNHSTRLIVYIFRSLNRLGLAAWPTFASPFIRHQDRPNIVPVTGLKINSSFSPAVSSHLASLGWDNWTREQPLPLESEHWFQPSTSIRLFVLASMKPPPSITRSARKLHIWTSQDCENIPM